MKTLRKTAFTLAEVMITLSIIGVIAALTLPPLINEIKGTEFKKAFKKTISEMTQAVTINTVLENENFANTASSSGGSINKTSNGKHTVGSLLNSRMKIIKNSGTAGYTPAYQVNGNSNYKICKRGANGTDSNIRPINCNDDEKDTIMIYNASNYLFFSNGSMFAYHTYASGAGVGNPTGGYIDVNGPSGPNELTTDANNPKDTYPVFFYDKTIVPANDAGKEILYGK